MSQVSHMGRERKKSKPLVLWLMGRSENQTLNQGGVRRPRKSLLRVLYRKDQQLSSEGCVGSQDDLEAMRLVLWRPIASLTEPGKSKGASWQCGGDSELYFTLVKFKVSVGH